MRINFIGIINILSVLLFVNAALMMFCIPFSIYYLDGMLSSWVYSVVLSFILGIVLWLATYKSKERQNIKKRDGYIIVTLSWFIMALSGAIPYMITGSIPNFTDAFFESISGFTTTGASVINNIEDLPESILLWRSLTQWIGGLGFIVLVVTILPFLGIGGMQLFLAEAPGISAEKLKPRIQDTTKRLWFLYILLTGAQTVLLMLGDMSFFDSINHSFTTMSTGGFSTKQASVAYFNSSYIQYVITFFMFLGGTSFVLLYLTFKGQFRKLVQNEEFRAYLSITLVATLVVTAILIYRSEMSFSIAFRESLFQVVSILTTTGFASSDFTTWGGSVSLIFFILMFIGASAGSTAGGVKVVRHLIIAKNSLSEFRRQLHPSAIIPVRINGKTLSHELTRSIMAFVIIYLTIFGITSVTLTLMGMDAVTAMGSVATSLGNIGPGLNETGPSHTFAHIPDAAKWILSMTMVIGRLELFTVLIIFTQYFWRNT